MAAKSFPFRIEVPVLDSGSAPVDRMFAWCETMYPVGAFALGAESDQTISGPPIHLLRFCFQNEADAIAFEERWCIVADAEA